MNEEKRLFDSRDALPQAKPCGFIRRWTRRLVKTAIVIVLIGAPATYFGAPMLAKSAWARGKAEAMLSRAAGTPVHIDTLRMSWKTGFTATNVRADKMTRGRLEITPSIKEVRFAPRMKSLCRTHEIKLTLVEPVFALRELADAPAATAAVACGAKPCGCCANRGVKFEDFVVENGRVTYDNDALNQPVTLERLNLRAEIQIRTGRINIELKEFVGRLNEGTVTASGVLAIEPGAARAKLDLEAADVTANDAVARIMKYLAPVFETAAQGEVRGKLNLRMTAEGKGDSAGAMLRGATGHAELAFNGQVTSSRLMGAVSARFQNPALAEVGFDQVRANITLADGAFLHQNTVAMTPAGAVTINGTTERSALNLLVRMDPALFSGQDAEVLRQLSEQGGMRVRGTLSQPIIE